MSKPRKFYVFTSGEHQYLRFALVFFLLFGLYLIYRLGFVWLYFVFFVILAVDFFVFPYLNASISFTPQGVCYRKAWKKPIVMKWEDIFCCGLFSANILGAPKAEGYFYFSAKPVSYSQLTGQNTLPRQSQDFLFLSSQPDVYETVIQYWNSSLCAAKRSFPGYGSRKEQEYYTLASAPSRKSRRYWEGVMPSDFLNTLVKTR